MYIRVWYCLLECDKEFKFYFLTEWYCGGSFCFPYYTCAYCFPPFSQLLKLTCSKIILCSKNYNFGRTSSQLGSDFKFPWPRNFTKLITVISILLKKSSINRYFKFCSRTNYVCNLLTVLLISCYIIFKFFSIHVYFTKRLIITALCINIREWMLKHNTVGLR